LSENVDTSDEGCLGAAGTKEPDDVHFDRKGMSNHEEEGTSTLTHPAHGLLDCESEYCLQNLEMVLSVLVSTDFNESVWYCDLITFACSSSNNNNNNNSIKIYGFVINYSGL
jgi:hypothetical protein